MGRACQSPRRGGGATSAREHLFPLAALLLLALASLAAAAPLGELTASGAHTRDGTATGPLAVARLSDTGHPVAELHGIARDLQVRVDSQKVTAVAAGPEIPSKPLAATFADQPNATLEAVNWAAPLRELYVYPLDGHPAPTLHASGCLQANVTSSQTIRPFDYIGNSSSPRPKADVGGTQRLGLCSGPPTFQVTGDFLVTLWGAEVVAKGDNDPIDVWSGRRPDPDGAGPLAPNVENDRKQQVYLTLLGGDLSFRWGGEGLADLFVAGVHLDASTVVLDGAGGTLAGPGGSYAVNGHVELAGTLALDFAPRADKLAILLSGTFAAQPRGAVVAVDPHGFRWGLALLLAGTVAVPAVGGVASHRAWSRRSLEALAALLAARRDEAVVRRSRTLMRWSPFRTEAALLRIEALLRQGKPGQAFEDLQGLPAKVRDGPLGHFLRGHILAAAGEGRSGARDLARAAQAGPEFRARIDADPLYVDARSEEGLRSALGERP